VPVTLSELALVSLFEFRPVAPPGASFAFFDPRNRGRSASFHAVLVRWNVRHNPVSVRRGGPWTRLGYSSGNLGSWTPAVALQAGV